MLIDSVGTMSIITDMVPLWLSLLLSACLAVDPDALLHVDAFNQGLALRKSGDFTAARAAFRAALDASMDVSGGFSKQAAAAVYARSCYRLNEEGHAVVVDWQVGAESWGRAGGVDTVPATALPTLHRCLDVAESCRDADSGQNIAMTLGDSLQRAAGPDLAKLQGAADVFRRGLALAPLHPSLSLNLAIALSRMDQHHDAVSVLVGLQQAYAGVNDAVVMAAELELGNIAFRLEDNNKAVQHYR